MRDINRIMPFLFELGAYWLKHPDLRFGQLVEIIRCEIGKDDLFYAEDDEILAAIRKQVKK